jgi:hypothetical protein
MAQRAQRSLEVAKKAVPEGTFAVGIGLAVTGITTYAFFVACARGLSEKDYAAVIGGLWSGVRGETMLPPLEQEVVTLRTVARRTSGRAVCGATIAARVPPLPSSRHLQRRVAPEPLKGVIPVICFAIAPITYAANTPTRHAVGERAVRPYGVILGRRCIRLLPAVILWIAGVTNPVVRARLAIPPVLRALSLRGQHGLVEPARSRRIGARRTDRLSGPSSPRA